VRTFSNLRYGFDKANLAPLAVKINDVFALAAACMTDIAATFQID